MTRKVWFIATEPDPSKFVGPGFFLNKQIAMRHCCDMIASSSRSYQVFQAAVTVGDGEPEGAGDLEEVMGLIRRLLAATEFFSTWAIESGTIMPVDEVKRHYTTMVEAESMLKS